VVIDQVPHAAKGKILYQIVVKKIMGEPQFDATDIVKFLQVLIFKAKFQTAKIVFEMPMYNTLP
jgi:hypothetical protein